MSDFKKTSLRRAVSRAKKPHARGQERRYASETSRELEKSHALILGYTRTDKTVLRATCDAPDLDDEKGQLGVRDSLADWSRGDHVDAARILREHGEREADAKIAAWCARWARVHYAIGKRRPTTETN